MMQLIRYGAPALIVLGVLIVAAAWIRGYGEERCRQCREAIIAEYEARLAAANERAREQEIESRNQVETIDREYQTQLQTLDKKYRDAVNRLGSIRVRECPSGGVALSADTESAGRGDGAARGDGFSREISGDIARLLRDADEQAQRLIACQAYVSAVRDEQK